MAISADSSKLRVMVDTTILLAGTVWPRWPYEVLQHALRGDFQLVLSPTVIDEALRKFGDKFPAWAQDCEDFLYNCHYEETQDPSYEEILANRGLVRDVSDIPIALAAINAGVDFFVSEDKDFTTRDESTVKLHKRLNVLLSGTFLREVIGCTSDELEAVRDRTWRNLDALESA